MIVSNEPGYYAPERFGIRTENLLLVVKKDIAGAERDMLGFETISFAPIDLRPVERALLTADGDRLARRLSRRGAREGRPAPRRRRRAHGWRRRRRRFRASALWFNRRPERQPPG